MAAGMGDLGRTLDFSLQGEGGEVAFSSPSACLGLDHVGSNKLHCELSSISKQSLYVRLSLHRAASSLRAGGMSGKVLLTACFPM